MRAKFLKKKQWNDVDNHGQGCHSAKMGADSVAENTLNTPKCIQPSAQLAQKFRILLKKKLHWESVVHGHSRSNV